MYSVLFVVSFEGAVGESTEMIILDAQGRIVSAETIEESGVYRLVEQKEYYKIYLAN